MELPSSSNEQLRVLVFIKSWKRHKAIIKQLKEQLPLDSRIITAGGKSTDIALTGFFRIKRRSGYIRNLIKDNQFSKLEVKHRSNHDFNDFLFVQLDHLSRGAKSVARRYHRVSSVSDAIHYLHIALDIELMLLFKEKINLVLFFDVPHMFYESMVYHIAKSNGIRTLILVPSHFQYRFFSTKSIDSFGLFPLNSNLPSNVSLPVDFDQPQDWTYMSDVKQCLGDFGSLCWRGGLYLIYSLMIAERTKLFDPYYIFNSLRRMQRISSSLPKWRYPFRRYSHTNHLDYYEFLS